MNRPSYRQVAALEVRTMTDFDKLNLALKKAGMHPFEMGDPDYNSQMPGVALGVLEHRYGLAYTNVGLKFGTRLDRVVNAQMKRNIPERVKHKVRGTEYDVIGLASGQSSDESLHGIEGTVFVVYRCVTDGRLWVRPHSEFTDGRFEVIA